MWWFVGGGAVEAEIHFPRPPAHEVITLRADAVSQWPITQLGGSRYQVTRLQGNVSIAQGAGVARGDDGVVWVAAPQKPGEPTRVFAYLEGAGSRPIAIECYEGPEARRTPAAPPLARQQAPTWMGQYATSVALDWRTPNPTPPPAAKPAIYERGMALLESRLGDSDSVQHALATSDGASSGGVEPAQFQQQISQQRVPQQLAQQPFFAPPTVTAPGPEIPNASGFRQVDVYPRSDVGGRAEYRPQQGVAIITGGVNIIVQGVQAAGLPQGFGPVDKIDLETDRAVIWTTPGAGVSNSFQQQNEMPLEIYMEGNIVFRAGDRTVYADRMYYDVRRQAGVILNAELLTPLPEVDDYQYRGLVRLKAGAIRQLDDSRFVASDALFTTSRLEEPTYSLNSETITFQDIRRPVIDPATGITTFEHDRLARSQSNTIEVGGAPIFYWPTFASNLTDPTFYVSDFRIRNDNIFGFQTLVDLNVFEIFGLEEPRGVEWDLSLDYLSDRGFGYGTNLDYTVDQFLGINGPAAGKFDVWAINDNGFDNLGLGRRNIIPEKDYRGRLFWNHRQRFVDGLLDGWVGQAEVGWISDRTFLEQFYETEWDQNKDQITGARLRRIFDNQSISIEANGRVNDFFTQTQWLPRIDHWLMGQELAGDTLTWFAHSQAAYANLKVASTPTNAILAPDFVRFPWEVDGAGERIATRQEIDLPIDMAPFKVVPYLLGEYAHWGSDVVGDDRQRGYFQAGVRASIPFVAVNPLVQDPLFNLNGLAHKVVFDAEFSYADANEDFDLFPLYDPIDDDTIEEIRRSLFTPVLPVPFPVTVDPRLYAIRTGIQSWVAAPTTELVEDQTALRLGMRQRLQTKRGALGQQRIIDWLTFDSNVSLFPDKDRDNFGEYVGLIDYDVQWHVGDRFSIVSDGFADVFAGGLQTISAGLRANRPSRGNIYLGYRTIRGPFSADLITTTVNYRLGPKWAASGSTVIDIGSTGNIGQSFSLSRIGESIITTFGFRVDESKNNVGFSFLVEPRFLQSLSLSRRGGLDIAPAGVEYLE